MNIALLSYHFHNATAEGLVTTRLARGLAEDGHAVTVFTAKNNDLSGPHLAPTSGPLAGMEIFRVGEEEIDPSKLWRSLDRRSQQSRFWDKLAAIPNLAHGCSYREWMWVQNVADKFAEVWQNFWPFEILHTRLNHPNSHLAGLAIKQRYPNLTWCAYFSDPWPHHLYPEPYSSTMGPLSRIRLERILDTILQRAGAVVFPSDRLKRYTLQGKRARFLPKAYAIPHLGNCWMKAQPNPTTDRLTIRHAGFLMNERKVEPLYAGLRLLLEIHPEAYNKICIEFAGRYSNGVPPTPPNDLTEHVRFQPHIPTDEIWTWMQQADVLLLVEAKMSEGIFFPSKLADYLLSRRSILALSPSTGVTADYLGEGGGLLTEPDNVEGIAAALIELFRRWQQGTLPDLVPAAKQRRRVSAISVIPQYLDAFQRAQEQGSPPK